MEKAISEEERDAIPSEDFVDPERRRFYIRTGHPGDVKDAVSSYGRADPPIPYEHFRERVTAIAKRKGFEAELPAEWKTEKAEPGVNHDHALGGWPYVWLRAHPFGDPAHKDDDGQYFHPTTDFHDGAIKSVPISYFHNWNPDGTPSGNPVAIGKTVARAYRHPFTGKKDGRWDLAQFDDDMPPEIEERLKTALEENRLRASPTVVPDFFQVAPDGRIEDWLTGSIAVLDADKYRQPKAHNAIGLAAMKALYKREHLKFPKELEMKKAGNVEEAARQLLSALGWKKAAPVEGEETDEDKELLKALSFDPVHAHGDLTHAHEGGDEEHDHEGEAKHAHGEFSHTHPAGDSEHSHGYSKAVFEDDTPEENARRKSPNDFTYRYLGALDDHARFDPGEPLKPEEFAKGDKPGVKIDWNEKAMQKATAPLKAQNQQLSQRVHELEAQMAREQDLAWFNQLAEEGKVLPAEQEKILGNLAQLRSVSSPLMKAGGAKTSVVAEYKDSFESRRSFFGPFAVDKEQLGFLKASGTKLNLAGFDAKPESQMSKEEHDHLLGAAPIGQLELEKQRKQA